MSHNPRRSFRDRFPRRESNITRLRRDAQALEHQPEETLTEDERIILAAYSDYENNACDRAQNR